VSIGSYLPDQRCRAGLAWNLSSVTREGTPHPKPIHRFQALLGHESAEYKQVTVLFADVVHWMDIAAAVGAERLREIMAELVNRAAVVVQRHGGTVDKFTGDGIMAVFTGT
jgi:class 3 adenylate cyclase